MLGVKWPHLPKSDLSLNVLTQWRQWPHLSSTGSGILRRRVHKCHVGSITLRILDPILLLLNQNAMPSSLSLIVNNTREVTQSSRTEHSLTSLIFMVLSYI